MATTLTTTEPTAGNADQSLPDASSGARDVLAMCVIISIVLAIVLNLLGWTGRAWAPPTGGGMNLSAFAGLYAGAQVLERAMELVVPLLRVPVPETGTDAEKVAQVKADRAKYVLGLTTILGVIISCVFGLFFLQTIGIHAGSNTVDSFVTGLLIGAGTKPLHDFISTLQNQNTPKTGTGTNV
jgi:hypothetical protein